jgi:hypothetical protein
VPGTQFTTVGQPLTFQGFSVSDLPKDWLTGVTIHVDNGTLQVPAEQNLVVTGNGTSQISVSGTFQATYLAAGNSQTINTIPIDSINAALNGLTYTPSPGFSGSTMLYINPVSPGYGATGSKTVGIEVSPSLSP